ncbi:ribosome small subunit-dependent GTPase A [Longibacter salinarum]|uniref:Small ribosomal subunit biogenesis GTPase RsgA n=1 Tax=Longibacter salinarum TaxID=1850348 RepID=A0A2A8CZD7_9BACT|nr:ribosome small subunit-dependent GTPase A [Longibacter salinarum]PEN13971.1 ribosome small subunit-dependent GTPase A [Longibacter salinarum]
MSDATSSSSPRTDDASTDAPNLLDGVVTRSTGSWYEVQVGDRTIPSRVRGKFRLEQQEADQTNPVAVGDRVTIRINEDDDTGFIIDIHERETKLSRRAAGRRAGQEHVIVANVDFAWAVQAVRMPKLNPGFIDRFLISADMFDVPAGIILNKIDLLDEADAEEIEDIAEMYDELGYPVLRTSATEETGIEDLRDRLENKISVVAGPSGAGKSSLLNAIEPGLDVETGEVSEKTEKGKHTTTFAELHPISGGGFIVDTPGIREFGILELHPADLAHFFVEFVPYLDDCKFQDCTHDHEPGCAVKDAVDRGEIHARRYESYLNILYSLQEGEEGIGR